MKEILAQLVRGESLSASQAERVFERMMGGEADGAQVGALLALLAAREPTVEELVGVATVMRRHMTPIVHGEIDAGAIVDTCGTGGVGSRLFNVSTTAAIVAAACGVRVAKHGNRSVTSRSGSSDVLRVLGVNVEATPEVEARCLWEAGVCFAFAPKHNPAMRHVAPIRQALGFSTIFNLVGPLTNPAGALRQLVGTKSRGMVEKVLEVLIRLGAKRSMVVCGEDGMGGVLCDISVCGATYVAGFDGEETGEFEVVPEDVGLKRHGVEMLEIASAQESAALVEEVLSGEEEGKAGAAKDMVLINAAGALWVAGRVEDLKGGVEMAREGLESGRARETLRKLVRISNA